MNNLKFFICAVGEKIVGLFRNPRRNVVEVSTSEFLDVYSRMTTPGFCFVKIGMSGDYKFNDGSREKYFTVVCKPAEAPVFTFMSSGEVLHPEEVRKVAFHTTFGEEELIHAFDVPHLTAIEMIRILGMGNESIGIKFNGDGVVVKHAVPSSFTMEML